MNRETRLQGLSLKVGPLGENDRLLTILSEEQGISRLAVPGARKPKSSLAAAVPLTFLDLDIVGKSKLKRVRHIKVLRSYSKLGQQLDTLAAAQAIAELCLLLVANNYPSPGILNTVLIHLERLEQEDPHSELYSLKILAKSIQSFIHLLALGGYGLPVQKCCRTGEPLDPPIGNWEWKCSLIPEEGFAIGLQSGSKLDLNPSELALLQRLLKPQLPIRKDGQLLGPKEVWLKLLALIEHWISYHLQNNMLAIKMLQGANSQVKTSLTD